MNITPTEIPEVLVIEPMVHRDDRGFFLETYQQKSLESRGVIARFVQDNHSKSKHGTLRGLHYQLQTPQGKLVQVISGQVYDVAVDIRRSSPTFGRWVSATLSADDHRQLWIPPGFAHGFYVLSEWADVLYKCTEYYDAPQDRSLRWDDPDIGIDWPLISGCSPLLSKKDASAPRLRDATTYP